MITRFQRFIRAVRLLWALTLLMLWLAAALFTACAAIDSLKPITHSATERVMLLLATILFIIPPAMGIPGVIGLLIWAPVDLLLGWICGAPTLLPWQKTDGED